MKCINCFCCKKGWFPSKPNEYVCIGVKEPFVIDNVYAECPAYPEKRDYISIEDAITHFKHGITHDIFSEPVTTYAKMAIEALEKQVPDQSDLEGDGYWDGELVYDTGYCPRCHHEYELEYHAPKFCENCGQALKWN